MKKIISLFQRNYDTDRLVRDQVCSGAEWVIAGEGVATQKFDGTCCMIRNKVLFKRYEVKQGATPPEGFEPAGPIDPETGKQQGWVRVGPGPEDKWHMEAFFGQNDGTYELCGPKIQGNPEGFKTHHLVPHGMEIVSDCPRTFQELKEWFQDKDIEGIVWHHPDGRMVKVKKKDFGLKR